MPDPATPAPSPPAPARPPVVYRGIVVVHGVGEHKKGSYVSGFVEELAKFLSNVPELSGGKVQLTARNRTDTTDTSWATINIENAPGAADEEWHIREAWWTRTFQPSKPSRIYLWAVLAGVALIWSAFKQQLLRGILAFWRPATLKKWPTERIGRPFDRVNHTQPPQDGQGVWRQPDIGLWHSIKDGMGWLVFTAGYAVAGIVGIILIGLVYLVLVLPLSLFAKGAAAAVLKAMIKIIVFTLGDQEAMTTRQLALAAAANEVNTALWTMLSEDGMRGRRRQAPGFAGFDTVTVVAHSGGCVVSLAALKSLEFQRFFSERATFTEAQTSPAFRRPARINWVTAGSGLNLAWNVRFGNTAADNAQWLRRLEAVNWLNIYARYDPVAQGPAPDKMVEQLLGKDPECPLQLPNAGGAPSTDLRPPFVALRVANTDSPWGDHGTYWSNHAEVMSRIVHVITGDPASVVNPDQSGFGPKPLDGLSAAIERHVTSGIDEHRRSVTGAVLRLLGGVAVVLAAALWIGDDLGRWVLGEDNFHFLQPWDAAGNKLSETVTWAQTLTLPWQTYRLSELLLGLGVLGFVSMACAHYFRMGQWLVGFARGWREAHVKELWLFATTVILFGGFAAFMLLLCLLTGTDVTWPWNWEWEWPWDWDRHS